MPGQSLRCALACGNGKDVLLQPGVYKGADNVNITLVGAHAPSIRGATGRAADVIFLAEGDNRFVSTFTLACVTRATELAHFSLVGSWTGALQIMAGASPSVRNVDVRGTRINPAVVISGQAECGATQPLFAGRWGCGGSALAGG